MGVRIGCPIGLIFRITFRWGGFEWRVAFSLTFVFVLAFRVSDVRFLSMFLFIFDDRSLSTFAFLPIFVRLTFHTAFGVGELGGASSLDESCISFA